MAAAPDVPHPTANRLLRALPEAERDALIPQIEVRAFARGHRLGSAGEPVRHVWFMLDCVVSLVTTLEDGNGAETGTVGCEGMIGHVAALGNLREVSHSVVQLPGHAAGLTEQRFRTAFEMRPAFRQICLRYNEALFGQILQTAACNAQHTAEARLARWLLMLLDRTSRAAHSCGPSGGITLQVTHDVLAQMLGVHRPTVSVVARLLQQAGLIRYRRGLLEVLDRPGLEEASCECYRTVRDLFERLLPDAYPHPSST